MHCAVYSIWLLTVYIFITKWICILYNLFILFISRCYLFALLRFCHCAGCAQCVCVCVCVIMPASRRPVISICRLRTLFVFFVSRWTLAAHYLRLRVAAYFSVTRNCRRQKYRQRAHYRFAFNANDITFLTDFSMQYENFPTNYDEIMLLPWQILAHTHKGFPLQFSYWFHQFISIVMFGWQKCIKGTINKIENLCMNLLLLLLLLLYLFIYVSGIPSSLLRCNISPFRQCIFCSWQNVFNSLLLALSIHVVRPQIQFVILSLCRREMASRLGE